MGSNAHGLGWRGHELKGGAIKVVRADAQVAAREAHDGADATDSGLRKWADPDTPSCGMPGRDVQSSMNSRPISFLRA